MNLGVLGTLTVSRLPAGGEGPVPIPGAKERALLGRLLVAPGRVVPVDTLVEDLWDGAPPATARKSLQAHVVRLRTALEPDRPKGSPGRYVVHASDGYLLAVEAAEVDASVAGIRAAEGHAALTARDAVTARARFAEALGLWRGEPFEDWRDAPWSAGERRRLAGVHDALVEGRIDADLLLGRHTELVAELERLTLTDPLREGWWWRLMLALYRCDRQADALGAARRVRALLASKNSSVLGVFRQPGVRQVAVGRTGGHLLVYGQDEHDVLVWDPDRPGVSRRIAGLGSPAGLPLSLDASPAAAGGSAGSIAVIGARSEDQPVTLWLVDADGTVRWALTAAELGGRPALARFTPSGEELVVETWAGAGTRQSRHHAAQVDVATGRVRQLAVDDAWPRGDFGVTYAGDIAADGRTMMAGRADAVVVHDLVHGTDPTLDTDTRDPGAGWTLPLATGVIEGDDSGTMHWHPAGRADSIQSFAVHRGDVTTMVGSLSGHLLLTAGTDGNLVVSELIPSQRSDQDPDIWKVRQTFAGHEGSMVDLALAADDSVAVSAGEDGRVIAWGLGGGSGLITAVDPMDVTAVRPRGRLTLGDPVVVGRGARALLAAPTLGGSSDAPTIDATFIDPRTRTPVASVSLPPSEELGYPTAQVAPSPDGRSLGVTGVWQAGVVDIATRRVAWTIRFDAQRTDEYDYRSEPITAVAWSHDGRRLLVGTGWNVDVLPRPGSLIAVDAATGRRTGTALRLDAAVVTLTPLPSDLLAAGLADGSVTVIDPSRWRVVRDVRSGGRVSALALSADGSRLAAVGQGRTLDIWDTRTWQPVIPRQRLPAAGIGLQWLPGRDAVVIGGGNGRAEVFDLGRRAAWGVGLPVYRDGGFGDVHVAPVAGPLIDLYSGGRPGRLDKDGARVPLDPATWLRHVCGVVARDFTADEWQRYLPGRDGRATCSDIDQGSGPTTTAR